MSLEIDIIHSATLLIKQHGDKADIYAAERADAMLALGDIEAAEAWRRVLRAIRKLQEPPAPEEVVN